MPRRSPDQFLNLLESVVPEVCSSYDGAAIFAPMPTEMARHLDVTRGMLYHGTTYAQKLEAVTGLQVVYKEGIVLGDPANLHAPSTMPDHLRELSEQVRSLSDQERARLLADLAINSDT